MDITLTTILITTFGTFLTTWLVQNKNLKEGLTNVLLKQLNKEPIKKIPLKDHKVFSQIKSYNVSSRYYLFTSETKSLFYREYIKILFVELESFITKVSSTTYTNTSFDNGVITELTKAIENVDIKVKEKFNVPPLISNQFDQWRFAITESLKTSIEYIINDDITSNVYFKQYRILDQVVSFIHIILSTGALTFNQMNGAFDKLTKDDIFK